MFREKFSGRDRSPGKLWGWDGAAGEGEKRLGWELLGLVEERVRGPSPGGRLREGGRQCSSSQGKKALEANFRRKFWDRWLGAGGAKA